jgi:hypothetical protein
MVTRKTYEEGLQVEKEHMRTYQWLKSEVAKKQFPSPEEFFLHIVQDHLKEENDYYTKLKEAGL